MNELSRMRADRDRLDQQIREAETSAYDDSFLADLIPQVTEQLAERYASDLDIAAVRARFEAWLAAHTRPA
jgi:hypothetical protein